MNLNGEKVFTFMAGMILGGTIGYLVAEVLVDRMEYGPYFPDEVKDTKKDKEDMEDVVVLKRPVMKSEKKALSELVRPYAEAFDIEGGIKEVRIIQLEEAQKYDTTIVKYYPVDSTFAYNDDEIVEDPNYLFGPNAHLHFGESSDDPDVVYIMNHKNSEVYEIVNLGPSAAYKDLVLGLLEPEKPKSKPKRSRRASAPKKTTGAEDVAEELDESDQ